MQQQKRKPLIQLSVWCIETLAAFTVPGLLFITLLVFIFPSLHDVRTELYRFGAAGAFAFSVLWPTVIGMILSSIGTFFVDVFIKLFRLDKHIESLMMHKQKTQLLDSYSMRQLTHDIMKFVSPNKEYLSAKIGDVKDTMRDKLAPSSTMHLFNQAIMGIIVITSVTILWRTIASQDWNSLKYSIPAIIVTTFIWINITLSFYTDYLTKIYHISINVAVKNAKNSPNHDRGSSRRSQSSNRYKGNQRSDQNDSRKYQGNSRTTQNDSRRSQGNQRSTQTDSRRYQGNQRSDQNDSRKDQENTRTEQNDSQTEQSTS